MRKYIKKYFGKRCKEEAPREEGVAPCPICEARRSYDFLFGWKDEQHTRNYKGDTKKKAEVG